MPSEICMFHESQHQVSAQFVSETKTAIERYTIEIKSAQRDANTVRALAVARSDTARHKHTNTQTGPITIHCAAS